MKDGSAGWWILLVVLMAVGAISLHNVVFGAVIGALAVGLIVLVLGAYTLLKRLF